MTCSGDQSGGINLNGASVKTLDLLDLTANIAPAAGTSGIVITSPAEITVDTTMGSYKIAVTGDGADGINLTGGSKITVDLSGDISSASGYGLKTESHSALSVTNKGSIEASKDAIYAKSDSSSVTVTQTGSVISHNGDGIYAATAVSSVTVKQMGNVTSDNGQGIIATAHSDVSVTSSGVIQSDGDAIYATSSNTSATVNQTGNVTSDSGRGIYAASNLNTSVTGDGDIHSDGDAIYASSSSITATVDQTGATTSDSGRGIYVTAKQTATITSDGDVHSYGDALTALSTKTSANITQKGSVTSDNGYGVYADGNNASQIGITGVVHASKDAINVTSDKSSISLTQGGNITSDDGKGIYLNAYSAATANITGVVHASDDAINITGQNGTINLTQNGNVTSDNGKGVYLVDKSILTANITGKVEAKGNAIDLMTTASHIDLTQDGDVTSTDGAGIYAMGHSGVTIDNTGDIHAGTDGIYAQDDSSGDFDITQKGDITAAGNAISVNAIASEQVLGAHMSITTDGDLSGGVNGIYANNTVGNVAVTVNGGSVKGSTAAIAFAGTGADSIENHGTIENTAGITALAISAGSDALSIDNYGTIIGNLSLSALANSFDNYAGGVFDMGPMIDLGAGSQLINGGILSPGGTGTIASTTLTGNLVQDSDGVLVADVNWGTHTADHIAVTGSASLAGTLELNAVGMPTYGHGTPIELISTTEDMDLQALNIANPVLASALQYPDARHVVLTSDLDFAPTGLDASQTEFGNYITRLYQDGRNQPSAALISLLVDETSLGALAQAYDRLTPTVFVADKTEAQREAATFTDAMMSCKVADGVAFFNAEGQCGWARVDAGSSRYSPDGDQGYEAHSVELAGGAQAAVAPDLRLGFAAGLRQSTLSQSNGQQSDGRALEAGAVLKYVPGPLLMAAGVSGSYGWADTHRQVDLGEIVDALTGAETIAALDARARLAYTFQNTSFYVRPETDLDMTYAYQVAGEQGGVSAMDVRSAGDPVISATPSLEVGGQVNLDTYMLRPYVRAGATLYGTPSVTTEVAFADASSGIPGATTASGSDPLVYRLSAGVDLLSRQGAVMRAFYDGSLSAHSNAQSGGLKVSIAY